MNEKQISDLFTTGQKSEIIASSRVGYQLVSYTGNWNIRQGAGYSRIGGLPSLPYGALWPTWGTMPLTFVAQIDLGMLDFMPGEPLGLGDGMLFFFLLRRNERWHTWEENPAAVRVLDFPRRYVVSDTADNSLACGDLRFKPRRLEPRKVWTLPCEDAAGFSWKMTDEQLEEYWELRYREFDEQRMHQFLGCAANLQRGDLERAVAEDAVCYKYTSVNFPFIGTARNMRVPDFEQQVSQQERDWMLLLQVDSDEETGMCWGDAGRLYFMIRKSDLRNRVFDFVRVIEQF